MSTIFYKYSQLSRYVYDYLQFLQMSINVYNCLQMSTSSTNVYMFYKYLQIIQMLKYVYTIHILQISTNVYRCLQIFTNVYTAIHRECIKKCLQIIKIIKGCTATYKQIKKWRYMLLITRNSIIS